MPLYRVMVSVESGNDLTIDDCVNTFYLQDLGPTSNPGALCQDAANLWGTFRNYPEEVTRITAKIYDFTDVGPDPPPNPPLETKYSTVGGAGQGGGPREVALCLSFFATVNQPRRRGRLYIGPWHTNAAGLLRPSSTAMGQLQTLATGLANLGGVDVDWMQYSSTNGLANKVTNWWVDNEWDTIRSRGLRGTTRISGTTGE